MEQEEGDYSEDKEKGDFTWHLKKTLNLLRRINNE